MTSHIPSTDPIPMLKRGRPKKQPDAETLSLKEAAALLGWGEDRLARQIREGMAPGYFNGVGYDIRRSWIEMYLQGVPGFWDPTFREAVADKYAARLADVAIEIWAAGGRGPAPSANGFVARRAAGSD